MFMAVQYLEVLKAQYQTAFLILKVSEIMSSQTKLWFFFWSKNLNITHGFCLGNKYYAIITRILESALLSVFVVLHEISLILQLYDGLENQSSAPHPQQTRRILCVRKHTSCRIHKNMVLHTVHKQFKITSESYKHNNIALWSELRQYIFEMQIIYLHLSQPRKAKKSKRKQLNTMTYHENLYGQDRTIVLIVSIS